MSSRDQASLLQTHLSASDEAGKIYRACVSACRFESSVHLNKYENWLHPNERAYYDTLLAARRRQSYLLGRSAAKHAIREWLGTPLEPNQIHMDRGIFNQPVVISQPNAGVSITHCENIGLAIAFPEPLPMGIDLEKVNPAQYKLIKEYVTDEELLLVRTLPYPEPVKLMVLWTAKEALSKILKTGLLLRFDFMELKEAEQRGYGLHGAFEHFPQYRFVSFILGEYVCSIVYPSPAKFRDTDWESVRERCGRVMISN